MCICWCVIWINYKMHGATLKIFICVYFSLSWSGIGLLILLIFLLLKGLLDRRRMSWKFRLFLELIYVHPINSCIFPRRRAQISLNSLQPPVSKNSNKETSRQLKRKTFLVYFKSLLCLFSFQFLSRLCQ